MPGQTMSAPVMDRPDTPVAPAAGDSKTCILIGAGMDCGKRRAGCVMGPDAYRTAGIIDALADLGWRVEDRGNVTGPTAPKPAPPGALHALDETAEWTRRLGCRGP